MNDIQLLGKAPFWQIQVFLILLTVYQDSSLVERRARYSVRESKGWFWKESAEIYQLLKRRGDHFRMSRINSRLLTWSMILRRWFFEKELWLRS